MMARPHFRAHCAPLKMIKIEIFAHILVELVKYSSAQRARKCRARQNIFISSCAPKHFRCVLHLKRKNFVEKLEFYTNGRIITPP
eukprot:UN02001